jgi:dihydrofolate reductase
MGESFLIRMENKKGRGTMRKLAVFNNVTVDGYFTDAHGDMGFARAGMQDPEWREFASGNASGEGQLLFGRITYEMMASFWTTPAAARDFPAVAQGMNRLPKVVFSRTLDKAPWNNTRLVKSDLAGETRKMKSEAGPDMVILGSGSIVAQLAQEGLIDEFQVVVNPIAIGSGRTMFEGIKDRLRLKLTKTRAFGNGNVVLYYKPAA